MSDSDSDPPRDAPVFEALYHAVVTTDDKASGAINDVAPHPLSDIKVNFRDSLQEDIEERFIDGDNMLDDDGCSPGHVELEMQFVGALEVQEGAESSRRNKGEGKRKKAKKKGGAISSVHRSERMRQQVHVLWRAPLRR
jgi:hypothetical protein